MNWPSPMSGAGTSNGEGSSRSRLPSMRLTAPLLMSGASKTRGSLCLWWTLGNGPLNTPAGRHVENDVEELHDLLLIILPALVSRHPFITRLYFSGLCRDSSESTGQENQTGPIFDTA